MRLNLLFSFWQVALVAANSEQCPLSNIHSVFSRYPDSAPRFCTSYLHYPTTHDTITQTNFFTHSPAKTKTVVDKSCTSTSTIVYDTAYIPTGHATTVTELDVTYTAVSLTFGGSFIEERRFKVRAAPTKPIPIVPRDSPFPSPVQALTSCTKTILSPACSSIAHTPTTRTIVHNTTITPTTTVTALSCKVTDYAFDVTSLVVPSSTSYSKGFKTKTVAITTETVEYFCYPYGVGCVTRVPTPCCPGTCTDVGFGYPLCVPTNSAERSSFISSLQN